MGQTQGSEGVEVRDVAVAITTTGPEAAAAGDGAVVQRRTDVVARTITGDGSLSQGACQGCDWTMMW
jgi:hypothetical protein